MKLEEVKKLNIPRKPGVYQFKDKKGVIIYVGKAAILANRVLSYWQKSVNHSPTKFVMMNQIEKISWIETDSEIEALLLESNLIKKYQPQFNVLMRDDKRYAYIKISTEDQIPGITITRKIDKSGKYFGPYISTQAIRETLKAIRKIWPYCNMRKIQAKPCFHYQIGLCTGVCGSVIDRNVYLEKVIKPIILFLENKKGKIIKNYELRIKNLERTNKKFDKNDLKYIENETEINGLKYLLLNMRRVLEHTNILSLMDKYAADVVELAKVLSLPKVPERIEGYDISNIFGNEAVGSMVVFSGGEPDKNQYRKFKIRIGQGLASDTRMLKEVLERRFKHSTQETEDRWPMPHLLVIDGGKGQLNAAVAVIKKNKLYIPVIAISKGSGLRSALAPDKLFFPGQKKPLELPLASPALHLIKRVRDEAHRFAIGYHRKLKSSRLFK